MAINADKLTTKRVDLLPKSEARDVFNSCRVGIVRLYFCRDEDGARCWLVIHKLTSMFVGVVKEDS